MSSLSTKVSKASSRFDAEKSVRNMRINGVAVAHLMEDAEIAAYKAGKAGKSLPKASIRFDAHEYVDEVIRAFGPNVVPESWDTVRSNLSGVRQPTTTEEWIAAEQSARKRFDIARDDLCAPDDLPEIVIGLDEANFVGSDFHDGYYHSFHCEDYRLAVERIDEYGEAWHFIAADFYQWRVAQARLALERA